MIYYECVIKIKFRGCEVRNKSYFFIDFWTENRETLRHSSNL